MLIAHKIEKSFGVQTVLDGAALTLHAGESVGLVGRNGCGKTTLIRILAGLLQPDRGSAQVAHGRSVGYLPQQPDWPPGSTALDVALSSGCQEWEARKVLAGLGLGPEQHGQDADTLSGGEKTRLLLGRTLLGQQNILLLDEPTNHLDIRMLEFVEEVIRDRKGATLTVSHDRRFLDRTVSRIVELEDGKLRSFRGGYTAYREAKEEALRRQEALYIDQQKQIRLLQQFVTHQLERARKVASGPKAGSDFHGRVASRMARRAKAARSRLDRMQKIEKVRHAPEVRFELSARSRSGIIVLEAKGLGRRFDDRWLFRDVNLVVTEGQRIGIVGPNGSGKTTLVRLLLGLDEPTEGRTRMGASVILAYSAQEQETVRVGRTVLEELRSVGGIDEPAGRALLACFLFRADDVFKRVRSLSMGERARLGLAKAAVSGANLLVLDEPTNYLDIPACERLEAALEGYDGTLIVVSHDRYLLDRLCERRIWVEEGAVSMDLD
jgi:ATPase subunit of ABC transporter with duplicated ATPase domains